MTALASPANVMQRLEDIERDLADRQNELEVAGFEWFHAKRRREEVRAREYIAAEGTVDERKSHAIIKSNIGVEEEARWEALRAVVSVLETRATIGAVLLKAQGRA